MEITGRLWINIVQAKALAVTSPNHTRPYCVVEFDRNELITREPLQTICNPDKSVEVLWKHEATL